MVAGSHDSDHDDDVAAVVSAGSDDDRESGATGTLREIERRIERYLLVSKHRT
jgi:hypothetical protein